MITLDKASDEDPSRQEKQPHHQETSTTGQPDSDSASLGQRLRLEQRKILGAVLLNVTWILNTAVFDGEALDAVRWLAIIIMEEERPVKVSAALQKFLPSTYGSNPFVAGQEAEAEQYDEALHRQMLAAIQNFIDEQKKDWPRVQGRDTHT